MSNEHYEALLKNGVPGDLNPTEILILSVIAYRYNALLKKSYPGIDELMKITGLSRSSVERNITSLCDKGYLRRITLGKRGTRAEYVPVYALQLKGESVSQIRHLDKKYKSHLRPKSVSSTTKQSLIYDQTESHAPDTISNISNHKYDKYPLSDYELRKCRKFIETFPADIQPLITPGKNMFVLLEKLEQQGTTLQTLQAHFKTHNVSKGGKIGGVVISVLESLLAHKTGIKSSPKSGCAECDSNFYLSEMKPGVDGVFTNECPNCHPRQKELRRVQEKKALGNAVGFDSVFRNVND